MTIRLGLLAIALAAVPHFAFAQASSVSPCVAQSAGGCTAVSAANPLPVTGGGGGGGAATIADGADVNAGTTTDAATAAGGAGTVSAKLRETTALLSSILSGVTAPLPPPSGTPTQTSVSCGTSSTTLLAASTATTFVTVKVPAGSTVPVWVNWAGSAAVAAAPSLDIPSGGSVSWSAVNYVPTSQINCLATTATTVTLIYK